MVEIHAPPEHYESPIVRYGLRIVAVVLVVVGVVSAVTITASIRDARASASWPSVPGQVSESTVEESSSGTSRSFKASVRYDYAVDGRTYTNHAIGFSDSGGADRAGAEGVTAKYPNKSAVTVYYNPTDPQNAVLERGTSTRVYAMALLPPGLIVLAVMLWRAQRKAEKASEA